MRYSTKIISYQLLQVFHADVVSGAGIYPFAIASTSVILITFLNARPAMMVHFRAAVCTEQQTREQSDRADFGVSAFAFTDSLNTVECVLINQGGMCVLENHPFVIAVDNDLFALVRLLSSLKVDSMPQILNSFQNVTDGLINPFARSLRAVALLIPISPVVNCTGGRNISGSENIRNLCRA